MPRKIFGNSHKKHLGIPINGVNKLSRLTDRCVRRDWIYFLRGFGSSKVAAKWKNPL